LIITDTSYILTLLVKLQF